MPYSLERVEEFVEKVRTMLNDPETINLWSRMMYGAAAPQLFSVPLRLFNEFCTLERWEKANVLYHLRDDILRIHEKGFQRYVLAARKGDEE